MTGNKGEWSEIYALLKIVYDKQLFAGDSDLNNVEGLVFPIVKVLREESGGTFEYEYDKDLVIVKGGDEQFRIPLSTFGEQAKRLLSKIEASSTATFSIPEVEEFLKSFECTSLKAKSSVKSDIKVVIHDHKTGGEPELGFSVKSQIGGASTLLNAGKTTNFIYEVVGLQSDDGIQDEINAIEGRSKIKDRIEKLRSLAGELIFKTTENKIFNGNLVLIDSSLPVILSEIILLFFTSTKSKVVDLVGEISKSNPMGYSQHLDHPYYEYKVKRFLTDVALGMMPSKVWTGELDATGGYLIVKEDGDVLCYHIYNRNEFENYLLRNTKLETASSFRHGFGQVYDDDGTLYFKLNLQIRFTK